MTDNELRIATEQSGIVALVYLMGFCTISLAVLICAVAESIIGKIKEIKKLLDVKDKNE